MEDELLPIVDGDGCVIGAEWRSRCHSGSMIMHPVVHLHVLDKNGCLLMQKRSMAKKIQPGKWDTAVGGHVVYGETISTSLLREAMEEIGLSDFTPVLLLKYEFQSEIEKELIYCHAVRLNKDFIPAVEAGESDAVAFWPMSEIRSSIGKNVFTPNFEMEYRKIERLLLNL